MFVAVVEPWANRGGSVRSASVYGPESTKLAIAGRDRLNGAPEVATKEEKTAMKKVMVRERIHRALNQFCPEDASIPILKTEMEEKTMMEEVAVRARIHYALRMLRINKGI
uniref:Uncharacterized protein n=1 Tax=Ananas comosus var. bracteatus TaxID=296719 RepID=A0A6V7QC90_ANACO|nr:unnamed protein product [Ananas comosus var. bracteatus]